jgi:toxin FitB
VPAPQLTGAATIAGIAQIAAICRARGAALATRNVKDLLETGVDVVDPWQPR